MGNGTWVAPVAAAASEGTFLDAFVGCPWFLPTRVRITFPFYNCQRRSERDLPAVCFIYLFFFCAPPPPYCHLYFPPVFPSVVITRKVLCLHLKLYAIFPESVNACRGFKVLKNVNLLSLLMLHWVFLFYFPLAANAAAVWVEFSFVCLLVGWQFESNASGITWHSLLHIKLDGWWKVAVRPYETAESLDWGGQ